MAADSVALPYALLGGFFMGSYPVPIKAPSVLEANVHPVVFQCYKSFWTFVTGWLFVLRNMLQGKEHSFEFTWWAVVSAMAWVPSGLCTIAAVPRIGIGMAVVVTTGLASAMSFLVFWLVLQERMKAHGPAEAPYFLAPAYLTCVIVGMVVLVAAPHIPGPPVKASSTVVATAIGKRIDECVDGSENQKVSHHSIALTELQSLDLSAGVANRRGISPRPPGMMRGREGEEHGVLVNERGDVNSDSASNVNVDGKLRESAAGNVISGLMLALVSGTCSATQFGAVTIGKRAAQRANGCEAEPNNCSSVLKEQFDPFGSWMASFGIGAASVTAIYYAGVALSRRLHGAPAPTLQLRILCVPGGIAGISWSIGAFFQTAAAVRGGNAVMMPANYSVQLITSGAWGLLYYQEVRGCRRIAVWTIAALWTLVMMVLLSGEKETRGV